VRQQRRRRIGVALKAETAAKAKIWRLHFAIMKHHVKQSEMARHENQSL